MCLLEVQVRLRSLLVNVHASVVQMEFRTSVSEAESRRFESCPMHQNLAGMAQLADALISKISSLRVRISLPAPSCSRSSEFIRYYMICGCGAIGRRAGFRHQFLKVQVLPAVPKFVDVVQLA